MSSTEEIVFYYNPMSRGRIAHWMLEEVQAQYRVELVHFDKREHKSPAFLAINPMGKVPAIVHRKVVVTESAAICAYLADAFPAAGLAPALTDPTRGTYYRWLFFGAGCVDPALVDRMLQRPIPERPGTLGYGSYEATLDTLEAAVTAGHFLLGDRFSAADLYISSQIGWALKANSLEPRPAFQAYSARCMERPAFKRFAEQATRMAAQMKATG